ncbi:MAG: hypothetical protein BJ554DRAFT_2638 [Olpidium bornovanus]|uniref:Uncharacterized protein n=1 Tax=Olpidium bornovanus TaxID=278681 RepID=A0A8H8A107_9FUNG|nr:MAG: hypothetical protein BJ554DRAFT_2638 [Olpidium bornovanus]
MTSLNEVHLSVSFEASHNCHGTLRFDSSPVECRGPHGHGVTCTMSDFSARGWERSVGYRV